MAKTRRERIMEQLELGEYSIRELSTMLGLPMHVIQDDLRHIKKSVGGGFQIKEAECLSCGFRFRGRTKMSTPSRCPECRNEQVNGPYMSIET